MPGWGGKKIGDNNSTEKRVNNLCRVPKTGRLCEYGHQSYDVE
jgi:hypothetical protein